MINICKKYKEQIGTYEWKYRKIPEMYRKIQEMYTTIIDSMERQREIREIIRNMYQKPVGN